jgi:CRISPR-associated protein Cmx8
MATKAKKAVESVMVSFDLFDLPTAQHKAGLAGLVLQIRYMEQAKPPIPIERIPVIETLTATGCRVRFTAASTQGLFDEVYGATPDTRSR